MQQLSRRSALRLLGAGASVTVLAACTPSPSTPSASTTVAVQVTPKPGASGGAEAPKNGGTLQIGTVSDINQLEGHRLQGQNFTMLFPVFDRLTEYDDNLQPQPSLAETWEFSTDAKQLKLTLRKGVQFHTGRELTSDDIKFNILRARDPKTGAAQMVTMGNWWTDIQTPDASTVILVSETPRPAAFDFLEYLNIVDPVTLQGPNAQTTLVGTGPFTFGEWASGDHLTLNKNARYWRSGQPYLDQVVFRIGRDPQAVLTQLEGGAVDAMDTPPVNDAARLRQDSKYQVLTNAHPGGYTAVLVNAAQAPFDKKEVRQALGYALNRQRYYQTVLHGTGTAQDLPWPSNSPAYEADKNTRYTFDLDKARSVLGSTNAQLDITYNASSPAFASFAQIFQADLQSLGLQPTLRPLEPQAWAQATPKGQYNGVNVAPGGFGQVQPTTFFLFSIYWQLQNNAENFVSDQYSQLITAASSEPDAAKRKQVYSQINDFLLDQMFVMIAGVNPEVFASTTKVRGLAYDIRGGVRLAEVSLA